MLNNFHIFNMNFIRLPIDTIEAPNDKGGIYNFRFRFPDDYELGLTDSFFDANRILENISNKLKEFELLTNAKDFRAKVDDKTVAKHLKTYLDVIIKNVENNIVDELILSSVTMPYTKDDLEDCTRILRAAFIMSPPIYVGMTEKQSLRQRLRQHIAGSTQFSEKVKSNGLDWNDLVFSYQIIDDFYQGKVRALERLTQFIFKPILSKR